MRAASRLWLRMLLAWITVFLLTCHTASGKSTYSTGKAVTLYAISYRLPLSQAANGIDGYLELKSDVRLNPKQVGLLWGTGGNNIDDDPDLASFKSNPPLNAVIQIVDKTGRILEAKTLERSLAKLRTAQLYEDSRPTSLLTVDYSAGFGSYSGPITSLWEVRGGHMARVEATEVKTRSSGDISLMDSLKTVWRFQEAPGGKGKQILLAECRPDWSSVKDDQDFSVTYARFYFDGRKWIVIKNIRKGYSDFEEGFPSRRLFP